MYFSLNFEHQGSVFADRFDANSYLYITRAMDYFDLVKQFNGNLSNAFKNTKAKFFIISFTSDWLYPTQENKDIVIALNAICLLYTSPSPRDRG